MKGKRIDKRKTQFSKFGCAEPPPILSKDSKNTGEKDCFFFCQHLYVAVNRNRVKLVWIGSDNASHEEGYRQIQGAVQGWLYIPHYG